MRELWTEGQQNTLLPLMRCFSGRKAGDDRDKVYALLSLAREWKSIAPDYSLNIKEVFQNTVLDIIKSTKTLAVLIGDLGRKNGQDLPSWVPDWTATNEDLDHDRVESMDNYNATPGTIIYLQNRSHWGDAILRGGARIDH